jgi:DNA-binding PadR family transcriptional regulator
MHQVVAPLGQQPLQTLPRLSGRVIRAILVNQCHHLFSPQDDDEATALDGYHVFHYIGVMAGKPMTGQAFFVLTALADGPRHGYGIVGEVSDLSQGRVRLKIGSLYGVLDRLAADGLIEPDREEPHDGRLRRYYRLTRDGRQALAEEAELRAATARVVRVRLGLAGAEAAG